MNIDVRLIIVFLLYSLSFHSNSKDLHFNWNLELNDRLLLSGTASSSHHSGHRDDLTECNYDDLTQSNTDYSGYNFCVYEVATVTSIEFNQTKSCNFVPSFFSSLLGDGLNSLKHTALTCYRLRSQPPNTECSIAELLYSTFCTPCFMPAELVSQDSQIQQARVEELKAATPNHLPDHVTIHSRSILSETAVSNDRHTVLLSNTEAIDDDTHIFDLFLNNPETQKWIIEHLNLTSEMMSQLIIPGLFNTALPATIFVQHQSSEENNISLQPSHFVSIHFTNETNVQYHIKKLSNNDIQVLAIVVSSHFYTLTFAIDNYDTSANQPPPYCNYAELAPPNTCNCAGACSCANQRINDTDESQGTDDSDYQSDTTSAHLIPGLEQLK
ncbi:hypothetical protein [Endozoicomonas sp. 8E]|uniref:hypothetical protein n=1 Tax=Endozoicomonas sp. 8E TaxID=3035692 RepID=UPI002939162F|nr:hypothetical protein [Endozoicomonas sp. 8E]WOG25519.1 hypothetical protein P6910_13095 [Endozoicomonas sp. 8E]